MQSRLVPQATREHLNQRDKIFFTPQVQYLLDLTVMPGSRYAIRHDEDQPAPAGVDQLLRTVRAAFLDVACACIHLYMIGIIGRKPPESYIAKGSVML